ncbi:uncharacterized protein CTRU02_201304 [Colletotrichum truncatum]|uniref:Uncharacterized protein n=1 Tax=Colletotrichum truncatum TaxID=5467 RepID=A0ACC3ZGY8_COLTU|nr:uncharacterized protein CTRU02_08095 [Colletotrichum truncatum]KAF6790575.1 hypothetical protein CTRU02_08095 [Colletotrichum truncatum]
MRYTPLIVASLASAAVADFTFYCCSINDPKGITRGDIDWALTAKNGRIGELGIAGGAKYSWITGSCRVGNNQQPCARVSTSARTTERGGTKLKGGYLACEDPLYLNNDGWHCPF